jgi:hypothetical protein
MGDRGESAPRSSAATRLGLLRADDLPADPARLAHQPVCHPPRTRPAATLSVTVAATQTIPIGVSSMDNLADGCAPPSASAGCVQRP